jgi:hypothetical protein
LKFDRQEIHPDRPMLIPCESTTAVTPEGKIFILGGRHKHQYLNHAYEIEPVFKHKLN